MDDLTKEQRHKNMSKIKAKDTTIEMILRRTLWKKVIDIGRIIRHCPAHQI